jgi:hypothetical protein
MRGGYSVSIDLNEDGIDDCVANFYNAGHSTIALNLQTIDSCWVLCAPDPSTGLYEALQFNYGDILPHSSIVSPGGGVADTAKWLDGNVFVYNYAYGVCMEGNGGWYGNTWVVSQFEFNMLDRSSSYL